MLKQVYKIDENSFLEEIQVSEFNEEGNPIEELELNIIAVDPPNGLYKAKWNGSEWIEGATQEEINNLQDNQIIDAKSIAVEEINNAITIDDLRAAMLKFIQAS